MWLEEAENLAELLERAPLAGFVALCVLAAIGLFVLLIREKNSHQATIREVVVLMHSISKQWEKQLEIQEKIAATFEKRNNKNER